MTGPDIRHPFLKAHFPVAWTVNPWLELGRDKFVGLQPIPAASLPESRSDKQANVLERIAVRRDDKVVLVYFREVYWVQSKGNLVCLHLEHSDYDCRMTMKNLLTMLDPHRFLRTHRNAIVNLDHVVEFDLPRYGNAFVHLRNGKALPISKTGRAVLRQNLLSLSRSFMAMDQGRKSREGRD